MYKEVGRLVGRKGDGYIDHRDCCYSLNGVDHGQGKDRDRKD